MSASLLVVVAMSVEVLPVLCHRLITNPYPEREWDSVIVSSDPITIRDRTQNDTAPLNSNHIIKPQKRSYDECPDNDFLCLYGNHQHHTKDTIRVLDKFLDLPDDQANHTEAKETENPRNSYWTMVDSHTHNHPFDDKKGWVTLDPVPWSTSKISKWHPNKVAIHHQGKPWDYGPTTQRPVQQFWVSGSSFHAERPTSQWGIGTNDIITDNKPSDFPTDQFQGFGSPIRGPNHPASASYPGDLQQFQQNHEMKGSNHHHGPSQNTHPSTYPSNGNGEWILLSTTKGYSHPQRHRWAAQKDLKATERVFASRKIKTSEISKYHEEDLEEKLGSGGGNRKSDEGAGNADSGSKIPPQILYTSASLKDGEPSATFRRKVRLQVLPSLVSSSTSHGGLLEVDSNSQTVDEAQQEDDKMKKLKALANVKKGKIRGYKLVPATKITGKGMSQTNVMTLAAVGAGMIPATMALLVPMALGRRKRNVEDVATGHGRL